MAETWVIEQLGPSGTEFDGPAITAVIETGVRGDGGADGPPGPNAVSSITALDYAGLPAASGNWNLVVGNAAGNAFAKVDVSATVRSLLSAADGAGLRAVLGTGTADNTTYFRGDGTWQPLSGIVTTDAALLTSGTLADARLSSNVPLKNAANTFTVGGQVIQNAAAGVVPLTLRSNSGGQTADMLRVIRSSDGLIGARMPSESSLQVKSNLIVGGNDATADDGSSRFWFYSGSTPKLLFEPGFVGFASGIPLYWDSETAVTGSWDLSLARAGVATLALADAGLGNDVGVRFRRKSSTTAGRDVGQILASWATSTDATRTGQLSLGVYYLGTLQEGLRITADGGGMVAVQTPGNLTMLGGTLAMSSGGSTTYLQQSGGTFYFSNYGGSGAVTRFFNNGVENLQLLANGISAFQGGIAPASMADSGAANGTVYYSTTANRLVFKDAGGTVNNLY